MSTAIWQATQLRAVGNQVLFIPYFLRADAGSGSVSMVAATPVIGHSFIVSATPYEDLRVRYDDGTWNRIRFSEVHILFPERTEAYDYLSAIMRGLKCEAETSTSGSGLALG